MLLKEPLEFLKEWSVSFKSILVPSEMIHSPPERPSELIRGPSERRPSEHLKPQMALSGPQILRGPSQLEGPTRAWGPLWQIGPSLGQILDLPLNKLPIDVAVESLASFKSRLDKHFTDKGCV